MEYGKHAEGVPIRRDVVAASRRDLHALKASWRAVAGEGGLS